MTSPQEPDPGGASYQPPYSYSGWAGYPPPPYPYPSPPRTTSGWAIAAFVLGLVGCMPLGMIFGIIALVKTTDGRRGGRGLAIGGMVISGLWLVVATVIIEAVVAVNGFPLVDGTATSARAVTGQALTVGECVNETPQEGISQVAWDAGSTEPVGCDQPHSDEVFAVLSLSREPDGAADRNDIVAHCKSELQKYSPSASRDQNVLLVIDIPGGTTLRLGDHTVPCFAHFASNRVGSIKG